MNLYYVVHYFYTSISHDRIKLIFSALISHTYLESNFIACNMTTYLKDLTQSIGRYGGLSWQKLGLRIFGSTSSISTWCKEFG